MSNKSINLTKITKIQELFVFKLKDNYLTEAFNFFMFGFQRRFQRKQFI